MWKLALVLLVAASACSAQSLFDSCLKSYAKITDPAAKCNAFGIYVRCFNLVAQGNTPSSSLPLAHFVQSEHVQVSPFTADDLANLQTAFMANPQCDVSGRMFWMISSLFFFFSIPLVLQLTRSAPP